ncbi:hypothetical protein RchiOBHm_Chr4g0404111 [Rosa chinensis]|uniref:Uncharacterized protein n=1 Tax=Rosa chinensis TaxID=74649 RepID=A0A2P6QTR3_ROSCH|nr:hypothetical protein RchiOBHm_Chr4g0404111 [Rosa chinensis]
MFLSLSQQQHSHHRACTKHPILLELGNKLCRQMIAEVARFRSSERSFEWLPFWDVMKDS